MGMRQTNSHPHWIWAPILIHIWALRRDSRNAVVDTTYKHLHKWLCHHEHTFMRSIFPVGKQNVHTQTSRQSMMVFWEQLKTLFPDLSCYLQVYRSQSLTSITNMLKSSKSSRESTALITHTAAICLLHMSRTHTQTRNQLASYSSVKLCYQLCLEIEQF